MKRLYNNFGAGNSKIIDYIAQDAVNRIWKTMVEEYDFCPRDVELMTYNSISCCFAEKILRRAQKMKQEAIEHEYIP